jgi:hypothetical protein
MLVAMAGVAITLGVSFSGGGAALSPAAAAVTLTFMCVFVAAFSWSWGPIGWLLPSEICPLDCRQAGQSLFTAVNFAVAFATTQAFFSELCAMRFGVYIFFGFFVLAMGTFVIFFVPETKGVPIEQMHHLWASHKVWGRLAAHERGGAGAPDGGGGEKAVK